MSVEVVPHDSADHFRTREEQADLLADAIESGEPAYITHALGIVPRARA